MLSSGHDTAIANMLSQHLQSPAQDLHKVAPVSSHHGSGETYGALFPAAGLSIGGFRGSDRYCLQLCTKW